MSVHTCGGTSSRISWGLIVLGLAGLMGLMGLMGCGSATAQVPADEVPDDEVGPTELEEFVESEEVFRVGRDGEAVDLDRYFYGALQYRAEQAQEAMAEEISACLETLGPPTALREIAFEAARRGSAEPFEVRDVRIRGGEGACAQEVAEAFVEVVGGTPMDGYDSYVVALVMRPAPVFACDEEGVHCAQVSGDWPEEAEVPGEACPEEVEQAFDAWTRARAVGCFSPRTLEAQPDWDDRFNGRALVLSELWVVNGAAVVLARPSVEWVMPVARCLTAEPEALELPEVEGLTCRSDLRNRGVTYGEFPVFTFVEGALEAP